MATSMEESEEDCGFVMAMKLATGSALPMALRFAVELNLLQLIRNAGTRGGASASELAAQIPAAMNPQAAAMIDRILRLLAANSILTCTLQPLGDGGAERRSAAPVCKYLTNNDDGVSLAPLSLMAQDKVFNTLLH